jgi:hypothetical protein
MHLIEMVPGESAPICVFETLVGKTFSVPRSPMTQEEEAKVIAVLRSILDDEGLL